QPAMERRQAARVHLRRQPGTGLLMRALVPLLLLASGCDVLAFEPLGSKASCSSGAGVSEITRLTLQPDWAAVVGTNIYYSAGDSEKVGRVATSGGGALNFCCTQENPIRIAAGGSGVFCGTQARMRPGGNRPWVQKLTFTGTQSSLNGNDSIAFPDGGDIAINGSDIYWTDPGQHSVLHINTDGNGYFHQIDSSGRPIGIVVDATYV